MDEKGRDHSHFINERNSIIMLATPLSGSEPQPVEWSGFGRVERRRRGVVSGGLFFLGEKEMGCWQIKQATGLVSSGRQMEQQ